MNKIIIDAIEVDSKPNGIYTRLELTDYRIIEEGISKENLFSKTMEFLRNNYSRDFRDYIQDCVEVEELDYDYDYNQGVN